MVDGFSWVSYDRSGLKSITQAEGNIVFGLPPIPFPPRLFAEREEGGRRKVESQPFLSSAPALFPGQR